MSAVYTINKGVNKPIQFKGLKGQYIWWLGVGCAGLLLVFAMLYLLGVPLYFCAGLVLVLGFGLFRLVYRFSRSYGEHGLMKKIAAKSIPSIVKNRQLQ